MIFLISDQSIYNRGTYRGAAQCSLLQINIVGLDFDFPVLHLCISCSLLLAALVLLKLSLHDFSFIQSYQKSEHTCSDVKWNGSQSYSSNGKEKQGFARKKRKMRISV